MTCGSGQQPFYDGRQVSRDAACGPGPQADRRGYGLRELPLSGLRAGLCVFMATGLTGRYASGEKNVQHWGYPNLLSPYG